METVRKRPHERCGQRAFGLAFMRFALLIESWKQEMCFIVRCRNSNTCMAREDNFNFIGKALSHFGHGNSCVRKRLHVLCNMSVHKALYGNVLFDSTEKCDEAIKTLKKYPGPGKNLNRLGVMHYRRQERVTFKLHDQGRILHLGQPTPN